MAMNERAKLVISIDLELFWGMQNRRRLDGARYDLLQARRAVPMLLALFSEYAVRATWASVGLLFCESKDQMLEYLPTRLPVSEDMAVSPYAHIARIGESEADDPFHFAPSLIDRVAQVPGQEVASHSFANFSRTRHGESVDPQVFEADLRSAIGVARRRGIMLRSLVFPDNRISADILDICRRLGITAYRGDPSAWPYNRKRERGMSGVRRELRRWARALDSVAPVTGHRCVSPPLRGAKSPVNVAATRQIYPLIDRSRWLATMQRRRLLSELDWSAKKGGRFHIWWRVRDLTPHMDEKFDEIRQLLDRFDSWRRLGKMESVTMHEVAMGPQHDDPSMPRMSSLG